MASQDNEEHKEVKGLLPAPSEPTSGDSSTPKLDISGDTIASMKYDALGPLVVNSDGTLSRITNWPNMTERERERTIRVLAARNQIEFLPIGQNIHSVAGMHEDPGLGVRSGAALPKHMSAKVTLASGATETPQGRGSVSAGATVLTPIPTAAEGVETVRIVQALDAENPPTFTTDKSCPAKSTSRMCF
ncbi:hypothetical protein EVG20_g4316 [Dentipellis fragilis]|uniref:Uncharacterized protein n=1 Tax=Dentipellis fragilis TaxID=205917 RepID=A0A4Y9YX11_9AGAM|nr:hypothetical protein EVG20_g4316 [Dentipellis fragilis]